MPPRTETTGMSDRKTTNEVRHPQDATVGHDLDPNADGDLTRVVNVENSEALVIGVLSQDGNGVSVSVRWVDGRETLNPFVTESATNIGLSGATDNSARVIRKGPVCEITATSDAAAGTQNRANVWLDTHR